MRKFLFLFFLLTSCVYHISPIEANIKYLLPADSVGLITAGNKTGTCFILDYKNTKFLVTVAHVLVGSEQDPNVDIMLDSVLFKIPRAEFKISTEADLAVVKLHTSTELPGLALYEGNYPLFEEVYSIGNPLLTKKIYFFGRLTMYDEYNGGWVSLPALPGSSGSPVILSSTGKVVGITVGIPNFNYQNYPVIQKTVPFRQIQEELNKLLAK